jgi:hypothetical protein
MGGTVIAPLSMYEPVPQHWAEIALMAKELFGWSEWPVIQPPRPRSPLAPPGTLNTNAAETANLVVPLARASGEGLEGVRLRITAWPFRRQQDVTATLELLGGRSFVTIARLDAWPMDPHTNSRPNAKLAGVPTSIDGHHIHRFDDNAKLGKAAFAPHGNLPIARSAAGTIDSFRQFLAMVSIEFRIDGISDLPPPAWGDLL